jgi:hypothetical protein
MTTTAVASPLPRKAQEAYEKLRASSKKYEELPKWDDVDLLLRFMLVDLYYMGRHDGLEVATTIYKPGNGR